MSTTNPVFNVLATAGNQAPLAAGQPISALANGQIGVFNRKTSLAIDGTVAGDREDIFLVVGINRTTGGTALAEDISTSAGQVIQTRHGRSFTVKGIVDPVQQIWDVTLEKAFCKTDYIIKMYFDSTSLSMINGYNQISKSFSFIENCCTSDLDDTILPSTVLLGLRNEINKDVDKAVIAYIVNPDDNTILADQAAIDAFLAIEENDGKFVKLRLVGVPETRPSQGDVNIKYYKSNRTFVPILTAGFECNGTVVEARAAVTGEGSGYDLKQLENFAAGWGKPGPYRTNAITGLGNSVESFVTSAAKYNIISIGYDQMSRSGWGEYLNNLETIIGIPCADSITLTGLVGILTACFPRFGSMVNDVAAMDCTNTNTSTINNYALDGIESVNT